MQNRKTKTNTHPNPDPNRYRRRCPDPNARIQKFIHYTAIATLAIADCHPNHGDVAYWLFRSSTYFVFYVLFGCCLVVSAIAIDFLERPSRNDLLHIEWDVKLHLSLSASV